jgi:hypothetical protein
MKFVNLLFASFILIVLSACSTGATVPTEGLEPQITDGTLDGNAHPYVGLMIAQDAEGNPLGNCTGTLLSPTLFLTAGHCTQPAAHVEIWFDADVQSGIPANGFPFTGDVGGTPYTHPQYDPNDFLKFDLGVVVLDEPFVSPNGVYGVLPQLDILDDLKKKRGQKDIDFTAVGYGLQKSYPGGASQKTEGQFIRMVARPHLVQINTGFTGDHSITLSNNAATGGVCYGDSGGPNFIGDSNVLAGVTSFLMNTPCAGTGGVYRVDKKDDLDWLATFATQLQ